MKKLKTLLLMLAVTLTALALAACNALGGDPSDDGGGIKNPDDGGQGTSSALSAPTPNIDESENLLTWNAVTNASGYSVQVDNGTPIDNGTSTSYSLAALTAAGTYSLKVMAKGDGTSYTDSPWSAVKTYMVTDTGDPNPQPTKLDAPTNLQIDPETKILTWNAVANMSGYSVQVDNGTPRDNGTSTSYSLAALTAPAVYSLKVMAKGENIIFLDSDWSNAVTHTVTQELTAPVNLQIDAQTKTLTWNAVANASGYSMQVDSETPIDNENSTSYSLASLTAAGTYSIKVMAKGDGGVFLDSDWSNAVTHTVTRKLTAPINLQIDSETKTLTWNAVTYASGYYVQVDNGTSIDNGTSTFYSLASLTAVGTYSIKVMAKGNGTNYTDSPWSAAKTYEIQMQTLNFTLINGNAEYSVSKGTMTNAEILIPSVHEGKPVTAIASEGFKDYTDLTGITIPDSVISIGNDAFYGCSNLTSIKIPSGVTGIGNYAFYNCTKLTIINFGATAMGDLSDYNYVFYNAGTSGTGITVNVGANVTKIPAWLFRPHSNDNNYAPKIIAVNFVPNSVCQSIGSGAFAGCSSLTSIKMPDSVTNIGTYAFFGCSSLTSIKIPNGVTSIGYYMFGGCSSLTSITVADANAYYKSVDGVLYNKFGTALIACPSGKSGAFEIPDGVTRIEHYAFLDCEKIMSITFGANSQLTSIGIWAFAHCRSLTSIEIPSGVTRNEIEKAYLKEQTK